MEQLARDHVEELTITIADYDSERERGESISALNAVFEQSGQRLRVNADNLGMVMAQAAPLIAIDGRLTSMGVVPTAEQLSTVLRTNQPLPAAPSCCSFLALSEAEAACPLDPGRGVCYPISPIQSIGGGP